MRLDRREIQGINRFEVNGLVDVVMQMDEQSMHQRLFDPIHSQVHLNTEICFLGQVIPIRVLA